MLRPALLAAGLLLASCATLQRPATPQVVGVAVRAVELRLPDVRVAVEVTVRNPNPFGIAIDALDGTLALGKADVATARLARRVAVPARGEAMVPLDLAGDASVALSQVGRSLGSAEPLDYELRGALRLSDGTTVPFRRRGRLPEAGATP